MTPAEAARALAQDALGARALYTSSHGGAVAMKTAIDAMLASPSEQTLTAARQAWLAPRAGGALTANDVPRDAFARPAGDLDEQGYAT